MKEKTTLTEESYYLFKKLVEICEKTSQGDKCYKRLNRIRNKASDRWSRRHEKALNSGEVIVNRSKAGRPKKDDKKIPIGVKLPPWLNEWMKRQPESKAKLIETALVEYYQIPEHLQK